MLLLLLCHIQFDRRIFFFIPSTTTNQIQKTRGKWREPSNPTIFIPFHFVSFRLCVVLYPCYRVMVVIFLGFVLQRFWPSCSHSPTHWLCAIVRRPDGIVILVFVSWCCLKIRSFIPIISVAHILCVHSSFKSLFMCWWASCAQIVRSHGLKEM